MTNLPLHSVCSIITRISNSYKITPAHDLEYRCRIEIHQPQKMPSNGWQRDRAAAARAAPAANRAARDEADLLALVVVLVVVKFLITICWMFE